MNPYRVDLEVYNGPLDLLLFLIRREEVDIYDIPIARITEQYCAYVRLLERIDPDLAGDFLVMAASLMEIKSRTLLPTPPEAEEPEEFDDPRLELVRQLLEYKKYKDAARALQSAAEQQALKHARRPADPQRDAAVEIEEVQVWDLLTAFNKLLEATGQRQRPHEVVYDDTPIALHAADVVDFLDRSGGSLLFERIFDGRTKSQLIGLFLALLELIRQRRVRATQEQPFGPISIHLLDAAPIEVNEEDYRSQPVEQPTADDAAPALRLADADELDEESAEAEPLDVLDLEEPT
ncbi:MAG TPA: segregation/condensation protein A [Phycisphaerae bacterium]